MLSCKLCVSQVPRCQASLGALHELAGSSSSLLYHLPCCLHLFLLLSLHSYTHMWIHVDRYADIDLDMCVYLHMYVGRCMCVYANTYRYIDIFLLFCQYITNDTYFEVPIN